MYTTLTISKRNCFIVFYVSVTVL